MIFDQLLFYGGAALSVCTAAAAVIYIFIHKAGMNRLMKKLENEYGKRESPLSAESRNKGGK